VHQLRASWEYLPESFAAPELREDLGALNFRDRPFSGAIRQHVPNIGERRGHKYDAFRLLAILDRDLFRWIAHRLRLAKLNLSMGGIQEPWMERHGHVAVPDSAEATIRAAPQHRYSRDDAIAILGYPCACRID
jgi:hypothetical protein